MKRISLYIYIVVLVVSASLASAQSPSILLRNAPNNATSAQQAIQLKWYDPQTIFKGAEYTVYRKAGSGSWKKMTDKPLKQGAYVIAPEVLTRDSSVKACVDILKRISPDSIQGFLLLALLIQSFESDDYAKYIGIMYEDTKVETGKKYQYKVVASHNRKDRELGIKEISCGPYQAPVPPQQVEIKAKKRRTEFKWKIETDRYYGVKIYRKVSDSTNEILLTPQPLMVSSPGKETKRLHGDALFVDNGLRENVTYTYRLTAVDFFGTETEFTPGIAAFIADSTAPAAPMNLKFEVVKYKVGLNWEERKDPDLSGYTIYKGRKSAGPFTKISPQVFSIGTTSFSEESKAGDYYYYVAATDKVGNEAKSNMVFVHVHDVTPPATPQGMTIRSDTGRIFLSWAPNKEEDLMGYQIYRSVDSEDTTHFVLINSKPFSDPLYIDSLPKNAKNTFMYKLVAVDSSFNKSIPTKAIGIKMPDVTPPEQPLIKNALMKEDYLQVEWIANKDDDLWGYNLYRSSEKDSTNYRQININLLPAHSLHFTDRNTETGRLYHYYLVAIDSNGNNSVASEIYSVRNSDSTSGGNAIKLSAVKARYVKKNNYIHIVWEAKALDLIGSVVYRKEKPDGAMLPLTGVLDKQEFIDKSLGKSIEYYYEVRVYSSKGGMRRSEVMKVIIEK